MKQCIIVGQTNVGKTAFALSFAESLGLDKVEIVFTYPDGFATRQAYALSIARQELIGPSAHKTRCLQSIALTLPAGKGVKHIKLVDTAGLTDGIHAETEIRRAIAQTLQQVRAADLILHMVDAAQIGRQGESEQTLTEVDRQIASFAQSRGIYVLLASKMDQSSAQQGLVRIKLLFPNQLVVPVSALNKTGMKEVRAIVARHL